MIIKQIRLQNFRLFEDITVDFDDRLNVFLGLNGSGKSALLEAVEFSLFRKYINPLLGMGIMGIDKMKKNPLVQNKNISNVGLFVDTIISNDSKIIEASSIPVLLGNRDNYPFLQQLIPTMDIDTNYPLVAFYITDKDKSFYNKINRLIEPEFPQFAAFKNALRNDILAFSSFTNWFDTELNYENSIRLEKDMTYRSPKLQLVRLAFDIFLKAISGDTFKNLRIKLEPRKNFEPHNIVLIITKDGIDIPVDYLSAGEKSMILLVSDLVKRLFIANPSLENPLEGTGIVLIDEIDLHLHPKWQREVLPALLATFPNLQFIVTTHSPQVLSKIHKQHLFVLKDGQVKRPPSTYGKDTNLILNEVFDISERPDDIKKMLADCMQLLETDKIVEGKKLLAELTTLLGEDDPEIIHTTTYLNMFVE
jgi:predicted ATP-binding protein involved in virulence